MLFAGSLPMRTNSPVVFVSTSYRVSTVLLSVDLSRKWFLPSMRTTSRWSSQGTSGSTGSSILATVMLRTRVSAWPSAPVTRTVNVEVPSASGVPAIRPMEASRLGPVASDPPAMLQVYGTPIEGVLRNPADYDPSRRYPLPVTIHGGPTAMSTPSAFNVRNLGVRDAWDVLTGVDALIERGIAHPDSLGAMGWSQGSYISAFLTPTLIQHGEFDRRVPIPNADRPCAGGPLARDREGDRRGARSTEVQSLRPTAVTLAHLRNGLREPGLGLRVDGGSRTRARPNSPGRQIR